MAYILIVDDDRLLAEMVADTLLDAGHGCGWLPSAEEALKVLRRRRPDLLILDHDMPGLTGTEMLRKLRQHPVHYDLPVLMLTRMQGINDEKTALYNGAQEFLSKPVDAGHLLRTINGILMSRPQNRRHKDLQSVLAEQAGLLEVDEDRLRRV